MSRPSLLLFAAIFAILASVIFCEEGHQGLDPNKFKNVVPTWNTTAQPPHIEEVAIGCGKGGSSCSLTTCCPSTTPVCCGGYCCNPGNICCAGVCSNQQCIVGCCQSPYLCCGSNQCCT